MPLTGGPGTIAFSVPDDALVWINKQPLPQLGSEREFTTAPIPPGGAEIYNIRVTWNENGKEQTYTSRVTVHAGARSSVTVLGSPKPAPPPPVRVPAPPPDADK
jgi:uncharacterized protein (TIGR03000 family)